MYIVTIRNLKIDAIIGILDSERLKPQLIEVDCFIEYSRENNIYINYVEVVNLIENMLIENRYALLEDALDDIIEKIFKKFKNAKNIKLKLSKPNILDNCIVGVESFQENLKNF